MLPASLIRRGVVAASVVTVLAGCAGPVVVEMSPVVTSAELPPAACPAATGGGGKNVATFLRDVRVGQQDGSDRITFEFGAGADSAIPLGDLTVPKYTVSSGTGGEAVKVAGTSTVGVLFDGASAHEPDKNIRSYPGPDDIAPNGFPVIAEAKQGEDAGGHVRWAIGLNKQSCPEVTVLTNPPRIALDFAR